MENGLVQQIQIGKVLCLVMSKMNHIVYSILFVFSSFYLEASQIINNPTSSIEKLDLRSSNDSMRKYKEINPQKSLQFGFQALNSSIEDKISLDLVNTHYYIGESFYYIGDLKSSFEYLSKSLDLYYILDPSDRRNRKVVKPPWVLVIMGNVYYENNSIIPDIRSNGRGAYNFGNGFPNSQEIKDETKYVIDLFEKTYINNDNNKLYFLGKNTAYLINFNLKDLLFIDKNIAILSIKKTLLFAKNLPNVFPIGQI